MVVLSDCHDLSDYHIAVPLLFDKLPIQWDNWNDKKIALKVNLVSYMPHPFTTHPELVAVVAQELGNRCKDTDIFIIEGSPQSATQMYAKHGYFHLPYNLIDVDTRTAYYTSKIQDEVLPEVQLPVALQDAILVSIAVAKEHQDCVFTGCVKNLVGLPPTQLYTHNGLWKDKLHDNDINMVIKALNKHKPIDLAILDASVGTRGCHMCGEYANPPIGKLLMGDDAFEVDCYGCELMGIPADTVPHLN